MTVKFDLTNSVIGLTVHKFELMQNEFEVKLTLIKTKWWTWSHKICIWSDYNQFDLEMV
jgi:hypothetical protein